MGLMERDYMKKTPEERVSTKSPEHIEHQKRLNEMYALFAKGDNMSQKDKKRLDEIYELNRQYLSTGSTKPSGSGNHIPPHNTFTTVNNMEPMQSNNIHKKNNIFPFLVFTLIIVIIILLFTFYPNIINLGDLI